MVQDNQGKIWTKEFTIVTFVNFFTAMNFYLLMITMASFSMTKFGASPAIAGFCVSAFTIGALVMRFFVGSSLSKYGYKKVLMVGIIACVVFSVSYFFVTSIPLLIVIRVLHGLTFGINSSAAATIASDIIPPEKKGQGIGYYSMSQIMATCVGPFVGVWLTVTGSYNLVFYFCISLAVLNLILAPMMKLRKIVLTEAEKKAASGFRITNVLEPRVVPVCIIAALVYMCYASISSFLAVYAKAYNLVAAASVFFVVYSVVILITRPPISKLFDKKGENSVLYPALICFALGFAIYSHAPNSIFLLISAAIIGVGYGASQSSCQSVAVKYTEKNRLAFANTTYYLMSDIGMTLGPIIAGLLVTPFGYKGMYNWVFIFTIIIVVLYYLLHGRREKQLEAEVLGIGKQAS